MVRAVAQRVVDGRGFELVDVEVKRGRGEHIVRLFVDKEGGIGLADADSFELIITTYGMLVRTDWLKEYRWRLAILDEAQAIKNSGTKQSRAVKELTAGSRIAMTGTPVENRLSDLWSLFDFLNPGLLGTAKEFGSFVKRLQNAPAPSFEPLRNLVRPYILRRLKTEKRVISDLPDKTEVKAYCSLSKHQAALYQKAVDDLQVQLQAVDGIRDGASFWPNSCG